MSRCEFRGCRKPAHWTVDGWQACEEHSLAALRAPYASDVVSLVDGEPMVQVGGELAVAS